MATKRTVTNSSGGQQKVKRSKVNQMDNAQTVLDAAKSCLECPVCFQAMISPIYQCKNGHTICNTCLEKITRCGECRVAFNGTKIRNLALEKILLSVKAPCRNKTEGCNVTTTMGQLKAHLGVCPFRDHNFCLKFNPEWECIDLVNDSTVLQHLLEHHQVKKWDHPYFQFRIKTAVFDVTNDSRFEFEEEQVFVVTSMDCPVLFRIQVNQGHATFTCLLLKHTENLRGYRVKYFVESPNKDANLCWSGLVQPYRLLNEGNNSNSFCLDPDYLKRSCLIVQDKEWINMKVALFNANETPPPWDSELYQRSTLDYETVRPPSPPLEEIWPGFLDFV